jgi:hypothetical protein
MHHSKQRGLIPILRSFGSIVPSKPILNPFLARIIGDIGIEKQTDKRFQRKKPMKKYLLLCVSLFAFGCAMETGTETPTESIASKLPCGPNDPNTPPVGVNPPPKLPTYDDVCPNVHQSFAGSCRLLDAKGNVEGCADIDSSLGLGSSPECTGMFANVRCDELVAATPILVETLHAYGKDNVCYTVTVWKYR